MKDEIKKKIEEEALRRFPVNGIDYPKQLAQIQGYEKGYMDAMNEYHNTTCSCCHTKFNGQLFCIDCFEKGYSLAQQSVNSELDFYANELNRERIKTYTDLSERYLVTLSSIRDIFDAGLNFAADKYKAILSASQNQQKEKSIDWKQLRDDFFNECTDNIYCNDGNNKLVVNIAPHDLFNWFKNKIEK